MTGAWYTSEDVKSSFSNGYATIVLGHTAAESARLILQFTADNTLNGSAWIQKGSNTITILARTGTEEYTGDAWIRVFGIIIFN